MTKATNGEKAVEDALIRIEAALTPKPLPVVPYSQQGPA